MKVVDWNTGFPADDETERFAVLLGKFGNYRNSDEYADFQIHTYTDIALDRLWTFHFYDHLEPPTVHYSGGIDLQGIALGQGEEQLSSRHLILDQDRSLWVALHWQTAPGWISTMRYPCACTTRREKGSTRMMLPYGTRTGRALIAVDPPELLDTLFHLDFPADLLPGSYELRLVVYNFETLEPTVEVDVWEPELTLALLRLAEVQ